MPTFGVILIVWLVVGGVGAVGTAWLIRRVSKRRKNASLGTKLIASVVAASAAFGALGTLLGLVMAFGAVGGESVDPSQKARILAEGLSEAMNCTAFGLAVWVPSVILGFVMTRGNKDRAQ